jgi:hypothetical protein
MFMTKSSLISAVKKDYGLKLHNLDSEDARHLRLNRRDGVSAVDGSAIVKVSMY